MKKYIYKSALLIAIFGNLLLASCRDDLSSLDLNKLAGITIDTTGQPQLSVLQFERLILDPKVASNGIPESDLSYEWKINLKPNAADYLEIGTEKKLDYEVGFTPTRDNYLHQIVLTVTDENTGLEYIMAWPLIIRNSIGEGLVIAETPDGVNTDLSHIMSPLVTSNYSGESIKRNVYSIVNGSTLPGLTKQLLYTRRGSDPVILGITDNSLYNIKTLDYTLAATTEELFHVVPEVVKPQFLRGFKQGFSELAFLVNNGRLHGDVINNTIFGRPMDFPYVLPNHVAVNPEGDVMIHFYDETNGKFIYQSTINSFGDRNMRVMASATTPFNPTNLPNKTVLASINNQNDEFVHVLKDKATSNVGIYISTGGGYEHPNVLSPQALALFNLENAPEIGNAKHFVLLDNQRVLYYATDTKIYAAMYGSSNVTYAERYGVPNGEKITTLQIYQQPDYPVRDATSPYIRTNNKQLIMSTYNEAEGKVYILPMINVGVGDIDKSNIKTYPGFDRITAITPQL